jgi:histidinol-phosphate aminotransferase
MSARVALRDQLAALGRYHSPQTPVEVRLNTNESPYPPPAAWQRAYSEALEQVDFHRYPDRDAKALRSAIGGLHGVGPEEVFCANGSNEVLLCLLLAFGGSGRRALVFEPTYGLHAHIAKLTGMEVVAEPRDAHFRVDQAAGVAAITRAAPDVVFLCSPNNPTGIVEDAHTVSALVERAPGLAVVDEAYGQFSSASALPLREQSEAAEGLVVVRTFSKTWALAGLRLGYLVAHRDVVAGCEAAALPYHLSTQTQLAGVLALRYETEMHERVRMVEEAREALMKGLAELEVDTWPSEANFILLRPVAKDAGEVWSRLLGAGVLVRDVSNRPGLEGCLRVTVGAPEENERFLEALRDALG